MWHTRKKAEEVLASVQAHRHHVTLPHTDSANQREPLPRSGKRLLERLCVNILLAQTIGDAWALTHDAMGRPSLYAPGNEKAAAPMQVSISHTKDMYALMLHPGQCGIDVEEWGTRATAISHRFVRAEEGETLAQLTDSLITLRPTLPIGQSSGSHRPITADDMAATLLWSAKEAAYKVMNYHCQLTIGDISLELLPRPTAGTTALQGTLKASTPQWPGHTLHVHYMLLPTAALTWTADASTNHPQTSSNIPK